MAQFQRSGRRITCSKTWIARAVAAACAMLAAPSALALPSGAAVVSGTVSVAGGAPGTLHITQSSPRASVNWNSFSIGSGESVVVRQPSAQSVLLNRVVGGDPSLIDGSLSANGQVFLLNPDGIVFGKDATINVGGLLASTLDDLGTDASGRILLGTGATRPGALQMNGSISAPGGSVILVAPQLGVAGSIAAARVGLAAAGSVAVDVDGSGLIFFDARTAGLASRLQMLGKVQASTIDMRAASTRADLAGSVLNVDGVVQADGLSSHGGTVVIDGGAGGAVQVGGSIDASSAGGPGGSIALLGRSIDLAPGTSLRADGATAGGSIGVGAAAGAAAPDDAAAAQRVDIAAGATLDASAGASGHGGHIVAYADLLDPTAVLNVDGTLRTAGGAGGGSIETSGYSVGVGGLIDAGAGGSWLIDPTAVTIASSGATVSVGSNTYSTATQTVSASSIVSALNSGNNVSIDASAGSGAATNGGSIDVTAPLASSGTGALTLTAGTLSGSAAISIDGGLTINLDPTTSTTSIYSGSIGGSGGLSLGGTGTLTLSGANSYTGDTTVNGGLLVLDHATGNVIDAAGSSPILLQGGSLLGEVTGTLNNTVQVFGGAQASIAASSGTTMTLNNLIEGVSLMQFGSAANSGTVVVGGSPTVGTAVGSGTLEVAGGTLLAGSASGLDALTVATGTTQVDAGATLDLGGYSTTIANLAGSGTVDNSAGATTTIDNGTFAGVIDGAGALAVQGGLLTLGGTNSYTGGTTVDSGATLQIGSSGALPSGTVLNDNGTLDLGSSATIGALNGGGVVTSSGATLTVDGAAKASATFSGVIQDGSGSTALLVENTAGGGYTQTLSGANTYTGATTLDGAILALDHATGGVIDAAGSGSIGILQGTLLGEVTGNLYNTVSAAGASQSNISAAHGTTLTIGPARTSGPPNARGALDTSTPLLQFGSAANDGTVAVDVNPNVFISPATLEVAGGTLLAGSASGLDALTVATGTTQVDAGATLDLGGYSTTIANLAGGGTVRNSAGATTTIDNGTFAGVIDGAGALAVQGGLLTLGGANTYTGATSVDTGTLALSGGGSIASSSGVLLSTGSTLDISQTIGGATVSTLGDTAPGQAGTVALGSKTLSVANASTSFGGVLADGGIGGGAGGALTLQGGMLTLSGANSYTGDTTVNGGLLVLDHATAGSIDAAGSSPILLQGGSLLGEVTGTLSNTVQVFGGAQASIAASSGTTMTLNNLIEGVSLMQFGSAANSGTVVVGGSPTVGTAVGSGTLEVAGGTLLAGSASGLDALTVATGTTQVDAGATLDLGGYSTTIANLAGSGTVRNSAGATTTVDNGTFAGAIDGAGALAVQGGLLTLSGTNTYTGATSVDTGTLALSGGGSIASSSGVLLSTGSTLDISQTIGGATVSTLGDTAPGQAGTVALGSKTLSVANASTSFGGVLADGGIGGGAGGALTLQGGTLTLSGASTYTGGTTVAGGTLALGSSGTLGALGGQSTVQAGGTLDLGGTVQTQDGGVLLNGGTIANGSLRSADGIRSQGGTLSSVTGGANLTTTAGTTTLSGSDAFGNVVNGATLDNVGTVVDSLSNSGTVLNSGSYTADVLSNTGSITNAVGAQWNGNVDPGANQAGGRITNQGIWVGNGINSGGFLDNRKTWTGTLSNESGTLSNEGSAGAFLNAGSASNSGSVASLSNTGGTFQNTGTILGDVRISGGTVDLGGTTQTLNGGVTLDGGVLRNGTLFTAAGIDSSGGTLSNLAGGAALTASAGTTTLSGNNTLGTVDVASGSTLSNAGTTTSGDLSNAGSVTNSGSYDANLASNSGTLLNTAGASWIGNVDAGANVAGATLTNSGSWIGNGSNAGGLLDNQKDWIGTLDNVSGAMRNEGTVSATTTAAGGTLANSGTLAALDVLGGTVTSSGTVGGSLTTVDAGTLDVTAGTVAAPSGALQIGGGTVDLGGTTQTLGGGVVLAAGTLQNGSLAAAISASGGVVSNLGGSAILNVGTGTTVLAGSNSYSGATTVAAGATLRAADNGALSAASALRDDGTLDLAGTTDTVGALSGGGAVGNSAATGAVLNVDETQSTTFSGVIADGAHAATALGVADSSGGGHVLTLSGANTYSGATQVGAGAVLGTAGDQVLPAATSVTVSSGGALRTGGAQTLASVDAAGAVTLGGNLSTTGAQTYDGSLDIVAGAPVLLTATTLQAPGAANALGAQPLSIHAGSATLNDTQALRLGDVTLATGGSIVAPSLSLEGALNVDGGTLDLSATAVSAATAGGVLAGALAPVVNLPVAVLPATVTQSSGSTIDVSAGAALDVQATGGGSITLAQSANNFDGTVAVLSGAAYGTPWSANVQTSPAGASVAAQSQVTLAGTHINVGGAGIEADLVSVTADSLATVGNAVIAARMPYASVLGPAQSVPGLVLDLASGAFTTQGSFGKLGSHSGIQVSVGSTTLGGRSSGPNAGLVSVLPHGGEVVPTTVYLLGPAVGSASSGYQFNVLGGVLYPNIPVVYNDLQVAQPLPSAVLSSTAALAEAARRHLVGQAMRTAYAADLGPGLPGASGGAAAAKPPICRMRDGHCAP